MPGPSTIVTFTDADGDDFPMLLLGHGRTKQQAIDEARQLLDDMERSGRMRPTHPVEATKVEEI